jgi:ADP-ribose pyrophosphatase
MKKRFPGISRRLKITLMGTVSMGKNEDHEVNMKETISQPLTIESHGIVYEDPFKKIEKIMAKFEGFNKEYFVSDFGEKAAVLVVRDSHILLARQYRLFIKGLSFEIPGGKVNGGERPEEAAARECLEETGVYCRNLRPLIAYDPDLEYTRNHTYVFYTDETNGVQAKSTDNYVWLPFEECFKMIYKGQISDSLSIITILAYKAKNGSI